MQVLDISYPDFPSSVSDCEADLVYKQFCFTDYQYDNFLPYNLTELYVKNLFKSAIQLRGTSNTTYLCIKNKFFEQKVHICAKGNFSHLQKLVMSENSITYIQPDLINPFQRLKILDLAINKLGQAISNENYAKSFFNALLQVQALNMSNNGINIIPKDVLSSNNKLRILDLSHNNLANVDFGLQYLAFLEYLDLTFNSIININASSCNILKNLNFKKTITMSFSLTQKEAQTKVNFQGNPFTCSCNNVCFLKYLIELNETFTCFLNSKTEIINDPNVRKSEFLCYEHIVIVVYSMLALVTSILITATAYFITKEYRKVKMRKLRETGIEMYGKIRKIYVVFLSFSGDDTEFVMTKVYPKLESGLKRVLNTESECVATGGTSFKPGHSISGEIIRCIEDSSVVIFFLSDTFIQKPWCRSEVHKAFCEEKPIGLMMSGKINTALMPTALHKHYETFTRVHWTVEYGEPVMRPDWDYLCETIVGLIGTIR